MSANSPEPSTREELKAAKRLLKAQEKARIETARARARVSKAEIERDRVASKIRMSGHDRREQLIAIARHLFAEKGYEAVTIEEIAQLASVSKPIIYEHFASKEGLYAVVLDRETRALLDTVSSGLTSGRPRHMLEQAVMAFFNYIEDHPDGYRVLLRDAPAFQGPSAYSGLVNDIVVRCEEVLNQAFGRFGLPKKSAAVYAHMLVGSVALVGQWWEEERPMDKEEIVAFAVNKVWYGLSGLRKNPTLQYLD